MWERFSFYGMQGILLIYLSTILGAWLADRVTGAERTLFYAAATVMAGHISLSLIPGLAGVGVGLVLIAFGGVTANATSLVGSLHERDDPRRDAAFSICYFGINLGAFIGPLLTGLLQTTAGFHFGFGLAAVGMALGLTIYSVGRKNLPEESREVPHPLPPGQRLRFVAAGVVTLVLVAVLALTGVLTADRLASIVVGITILASVAFFAVILSSRQISGEERRRVFSFICGPGSGRASRRGR